VDRPVFAILGELGARYGPTPLATILEHAFYPDHHQIPDLIRSLA
jgi:hypothetical protein